MSHSWLQKKRKGDLIELAQVAKLSEYVQHVVVCCDISLTLSVVQTDC
jgi:hypothetical protein